MEQVATSKFLLSNASSFWFNQDLKNELEKEHVAVKKLYKEVAHPPNFLVRL